MDPILNCILAVCCPPASTTQQTALAMFLSSHGVDTAASAACASVILKHFDLAPAGSLQAFKDAIATLARGPRYQE